jgi:hypothetical protein
LQVLLDGSPVFERYGLLLAGGYAFRAHEILHRPSQDLDFATRDNTPLPEIAAHVLAEPFPGAPDQRRRLRALIGHAASFWTWHSLCVNEGLFDQEAVTAMTGMVLAAMSAPQADPMPGREMGSEDSDGNQIAPAEVPASHRPPK